MQKILTLKRQKRLNARIKENWGMLTDEEIALYHDHPEAFFDILRKKYSMFPADAERRINSFKGGSGLFGW